jgi:hypothetical protein
LVVKRCGCPPLDTVSWRDGAVRLIDQAMTWIVQVFVFREIVEELLEGARVAVPSYWWLMLPVGLAGLGVLWIASLYRFALKGVAP